MTSRELQQKLTEIVTNKQETFSTPDLDWELHYETKAELNAFRAALDALNGDDYRINAYLLKREG